jgi:protein required for attachment to host cells
MLGINKHTWIISANASECNIFTVVSNEIEMKLQLLKQFHSTASRLQTKDLGAERPGRAYEASSSTRHSIEPKTDLQKKQKTNFARLIASYLNKEANKAKVGRLILITSPEFLGKIRKALDKHLISIIVKEINKDLTHEKEILKAIF